MSDIFNNLVAIVQYTRPNGQMGGWRNMAAFDSRYIAEKYAKTCGEGNPPWIYRVIDVQNEDE